MSGDQKTVYRTAPVTDLESEEETKNVLYSYMCTKATEDKALEREQVQTLVRSVEQQAVHTALTSSSSMASEVGRRLAEFGDQVDGQFYQEMEEIVELTGTPEKAFAIFSDVVKNLFEWDENGLPKINVGRIAALLGYCYHLCRKFLQQKAGAFTLVSFLGMVGTWLVKFLIQARFYDWLKQKGGWGQLLMSPVTSGITRVQNALGIHTFLFMGVASLAIWGYYMLKK
ncbi:hypothetical protein EMCRGX_G025473 [Ephydatia muelleri]|eukprot:Em0021g297a